MPETTIFDDLAWMDDPVPREAALNMAIDEMLLAGLDMAGQTTKPLLRVYRWQRPTVSLGYFEPAQVVREAFRDQQLVRRWTGGGIVQHGQDFTYSLLVPRTLAPARWRAGGAYRDIHGAVAVALRAAGLDSVTLAGARDDSLSASLPGTSGECFENPVTHDVLQNGRKIAGAAQRRTRHGLLHQGSIQSSNGEHDPRVAQFGPGTAFHSVIQAHLPAALGRRLEPRQLTASELAWSTNLAASRYGTAEWLEKF